MSVFDEFQWRGMIYDHTEEVADALAKEKLTAYIGFDPSAASLHVGSLLPMMALARLQRAGHTPLAIVGGGTGLIGDPSGKTQERTLLTSEQVEINLQGIKGQLSRFLDFDAKSNPAQIINNGEWLTRMPLMNFLRDVGKHFTVNQMLTKESVKRRLEQEEGISFTEFSYMLLQAYDYLVLHERYDCTLQLGGSDQWGNILAGLDLVRRLRRARAHGLVFPLVTTSAGVKFGKTEAGALWLDAQLTSPFRFYQFWLNTDDRDVVTYLKYFTFLTQDEIEELSATVETEPEMRAAQRQLAREVTRLVHDESALAKAEHASQILFGGEISGVSEQDILDIFADVPSSEIEQKMFEGEGAAIVNLLSTSGVASSKSEARRLIQGGGVYLNNRRVTDEQERVPLASCIGGRVLVLRKGQKHYHLLKII